MRERKPYYIWLVPCISTLPSADNVFWPRKIVRWYDRWDGFRFDDILEDKLDLSKRTEAETRGSRFMYIVYNSLYIYIIYVHVCVCVSGENRCGGGIKWVRKRDLSKEYGCRRWIVLSSAEIGNFLLPGTSLPPDPRIFSTLIRPFVSLFFVTFLQRNGPRRCLHAYLLHALSLFLYPRVCAREGVSRAHHLHVYFFSYAR